MVNISWGTKILILIGSFIALMGTLVTMAFQQDIELVSEDYYAQELVYQDRINQMNNANALDEKITHKIAPVGIQFQFPSIFKNKDVNGEIFFFCPSDEQKDYSAPIILNNDAQQFISADNFSKGRYDLKIKWTADDKTYFSEEVIVIP